ncbi:hypothetical protein Vadar_013953 [Vaccinium darrowii]|uniref:Uncharacterized protein n=1 Tax=Vaccinium darrowii TaxID=229202 RepID=A0ACB7XRQ6_9ERIC|nr:hypothetical protein Vadar_013953 [Vaccinium darrowii]
MIPRLYRAAMEGQVEILNEDITQFDVQLTDNDNTVLHVAAQFGQLSCVESILQVCRPSLLHTRNCKHETPLHIAARAGNLGIVEALINRAKEIEREGQTAQELLRAMNLDGDTALHIAVQNLHLHVVRSLTEEDPEFSYPTNKAGESPLYLAVEIGYYAMVVVILDKCLSPRYSGPDGRTAMHHAAMLRKLPEIATKLLDWKPELIDKPDPHGWIPLHYAARCGNIQLVKETLQNNYLLAHIRTGDSDGGKTALHIAAAVGRVLVIKEILSACPECWETTDYTGHNILHIAAEMQRRRVLQFILKMSWSSQLINEKDNEGNTPLHLLAAFQVKSPAFMKKYQGFWFTFNNKNLTPRELALSQVRRHRYGSIASPRNILNNDRDNLARWKSDCTTQHKEKKKARQKSMNETVKAINEYAKTHVIVATLIATLTFTASFTIPGGYDSDQGSDQKGMAILVKKAAFKAFVIANTIAVLCSTSSVFLYLSGSAYIHQYLRAARSSLYGQLSPQRIRELLAYHVRLFGERSRFMIHDTGGIHLDVMEVFKLWMKKRYMTMQDIKEQESSIYLDIGKRRMGFLKGQLLRNETKPRILQDHDSWVLREEQDDCNNFIELSPK